MLIAHCSIPADDPQSTAQVLAEIMQGEAIRFPPGGPHAWMAWSGDGEIEFEVVPRGWTVHHEPVEAAWREDPTAGRRSEVHLAVCVNRPEDEIIAIAKRAGWPARHCERGGGYFSLAEVWVEGVFMIEFLDPAQTAVYKDRVTPKKWKSKLVEMGVV